MKKPPRWRSENIFFLKILQTFISHPYTYHLKTNKTQPSRVRDFAKQTQLASFYCLVLKLKKHTYTDDIKTIRNRNLKTYKQQTNAILKRKNPIFHKY